MSHLPLPLDPDGGGLGRPSKYAHIFAAGCIAGLAQTVVACPSDLVKVVLQAQLNHSSGTGNSDADFLIRIIACYINIRISSLYLS